MVSDLDSKNAVSRKMKILVVDDEVDQGKLYKLELEDEGYEVVLASTGDEAMELFEKESPDLVTLDVVMSRKNEGIELLRQMKQLNPRLPIIMLTAYPSFKADFAIWAADAYILKSSDLTELKDTIQSFRVLLQRY